MISETLPRYYARPASDHDDGYAWFVADGARGGLNVTAEVIRAHVSPFHADRTLAGAAEAISLARLANSRRPALPQPPSQPVMAMIASSHGDLRAKVEHWLLAAAAYAVANPLADDKS